MPRFVALLRAINVGGRTVKMQELVRHFEGMGFTDVASVIASGNLLFDASARSGPKLERTIEAHLESALGYPVATFLRSHAELEAILARQPFDLSAEPEAAVVYTIFLRHAPEDAVRRAIGELATPNDEARAGDREVFWLRRERRDESELFGTQLGRILGKDTTSRNLNTVARIAARF